MRHLYLLFIFCCFAVATASWLAAAEPDAVPTAKADETAILKLIKQLDSDDFDERNTALEKLQAEPEKSEATLP